MQGLLRGDRLPDYQRPDPRGTQRMMHDFPSGAPVIVVACRDATNAALRKSLRLLANPTSEWSKFTRIAIVKGSAEQCAQLLPEETGQVVVMVDDGAVLEHLLGPVEATNSAQMSVTAFALDSNLRVIERIEHPTMGSDAELMLERLQTVYRNCPEPVARIVCNQAPVLLIPRVLDREFCDGLIGFFEETGGQPSGIAHIEGDKATWTPDPSVKMRRDVYLSEGIWLERVRQMLVRRVLPEIKRCFNFQVTQHEVFKLIRYDEGAGYFRPHRDNESRDTQHRRFAMTLNLNTGDYEGGQLRFPEFGPELYEAERGGAAIFSCSLLHEAVPVTQGKRYALLGFFFSEAERMTEMQYQGSTQSK